MADAFVKVVAIICSMLNCTSRKRRNLVPRFCCFCLYLLVGWASGRWNVSPSHSHSAA